jgi:hypothetical protein
MKKIIITLILLAIILSSGCLGETFVLKNYASENDMTTDSAFCKKVPGTSFELTKNIAGIYSGISIGVYMKLQEESVNCDIKEFYGEKSIGINNAQLRSITCQDNGENYLILSFNTEYEAALKPNTVRYDITCTGETSGLTASTSQTLNFIYK